MAGRHAQKEANPNPIVVPRHSWNSTRLKTTQNVNASIIEKAMEDSAFLDGPLYLIFVVGRIFPSFSAGGQALEKPSTFYYSDQLILFLN